MRTHYSHPIVVTASKGTLFTVAILGCVPSIINDPCRCVNKHLNRETMFTLGSVCIIEVFTLEDKFSMYDAYKNAVNIFRCILIDGP